MLSCWFLLGNLRKLLTIAVEIKRTHTNFCNDIIADPISDPKPEQGLVDSDQAGETSSNGPAKSGQKDASVLSIGRVDVGSKALSNGKSEEHVSHTKEMDDWDDNEQYTQNVPREAVYHNEGDTPRCFVIVFKFKLRGELFQLLALR